jgi:secreted trypsin-like serine protease
MASSTALALALLGAGGAVATSASAQDASHQTKATATPHVPAAKVSDKALRQRLVAAARTSASKTSAPTTSASEKATQATPKATGTTAPSAKPQDGTPAPFIIGGTSTTISAAPWMVQLGYFDPVTGDGSFCGGTLVAPNKVLTAAHCVAGLDWADNGVVLAGATDVDDFDSGTLAGVVRQWNHPKYNADVIQNDIAVLTLDRPLPQKWLPIAASDDSSLYTPGKSGTVYGWGLTSGTGTDLSTTLNKATLPTVSDATCDATMESLLTDNNFRAGSMFCAGTPASGSDAGTTSTCQGDSGGPLVIDGKVAGIVSWGVEGCNVQGSYPVFTKVSSYTWAAQPRIDDTDLSGDGKADLLGTVPSGNLFLQASKGTSLAQRSFAGNGWQTSKWIIQTDLDHDGVQDLVSDESDGALHWNHFDSSGTFLSTKISSVWGGYKSYAILGDLTGDAKADLVAVDTNGDVYLYPGKDDGQFGARVKFVSGSWKGVQVFGSNDLSGDGKADLLVRDSSDTLWLYRGTGVASKPFAARVKARTGWNFTALTSSGDVTGDGISDAFARTSGGTLYLYPGTGKGTTDLFGSRISLGTGFNQYTHLF